MIGDLEKKRVLINIQKYVDFDMPATQLIMAAPAGMGKGEVTKIATRLEDENSNTDQTDKVIRELKSMGFRTCVAVDLAVGGGL